MLGKVAGGGSGWNIISCAGATNSIFFPTLVGTWHMYINGVFQVDGEADELSDYATNHIPNSLSIVTDNNCRFISTDIESNLRIKLVPFGDDPPASYTAPTDNPTFMEHEDGSLTFCLLKASNQLVLTITAD